MNKSRSKQSIFSKTYMYQEKINYEPDLRRSSRSQFRLSQYGALSIVMFGGLEPFSFESIC